MSDNAKIKLILKILVLVVIACIVLNVAVALETNSKYIAEYKSYCPVNCPNTLWTCADGDIYFASDKNGKTLGASKNHGTIAYYGISFNWSSRGFDVWELSNISYPEIKGRPFRFRGDASYSENSCTLIYLAFDDEEHYFGEHKRQAELTFIKSELTAPFSFDNEESLKELPFR